MLDKLSRPVGKENEVIAGHPSRLTVQNVSVEIRGDLVLDDVSVTVDQGECLVILGPSGCGKTTLLRSLAGLQPLSNGEINLYGEVIATQDLHIPPEERNIGMVFQDWALFPHLTVYENVVFGLPKAQRKSPSDDVGELLEMVGISLLADRYPSSLS